MTLLPLNIDVGPDEKIGGTADATELDVALAAHSAVLDTLVADVDTRATQAEVDALTQEVGRKADTDVVAALQSTVATKADRPLVVQLGNTSGGVAIDCQNRPATFEVTLTTNFQLQVRNVPAGGDVVIVATLPTDILYMPTSGVTTWIGGEPRTPAGHWPAGTWLLTLVNTGSRVVGRAVSGAEAAALATLEAKVGTERPRVVQLGDRSDGGLTIDCKGSYSTIAQGRLTGTLTLKRTIRHLNLPAGGACAVYLDGCQGQPVEFPGVKWREGPPPLNLPTLPAGQFWAVVFDYTGTTTFATPLGVYR